MTEHRSASIDYLPARMVNEFIYCPRLFYYEQVEGVFVHNRETTEGAHLHKRVDAKQDELPPASELAESDRPVKMRSVMLSSDRYGVIAKMDLIESDGDMVVPVDYKRGAPRKAEDGSLEAWDPDRIQLAIQGLILREHGYDCHEGVIYYAKTRQRIRIAFDDPLVERTVASIDAARRALAGPIPPPLADSPKCPRCSLVGICMPDETAVCRTNEADADEYV